MMPHIPPAIRRGLIRAGGRGVTMLFIATGLAACVPIWIVVALRGTEPGPVELFLRGTLAFASFATGIAAFLWIIARLGRPPNVLPE